MKKPLLKLLILSTLIYANTYNTKAENTLHSTSTDRHATAEYWEKNKNYERVKLLGKVIAAIGAGCILYCFWQYSSSAGISIISGKNIKEKERIVYIDEVPYKFFPWNKTVKYQQYKIKYLGDRMCICKKYATYKGLYKCLQLAGKEAVPKIIKCYQFTDDNGIEHFLAIMESPSPIECLMERTIAYIKGLKKINKEAIKYNNIDLLDMEEGRFFNLTERSQHKKKSQIQSLAVAILEDEYYEIIHTEPGYPLLCKADNKHSSKLKKMDHKRLISEISNIKRCLQENRILFKEKKLVLFDILEKVIKGEIETLDKFLEEIERIKQEEIKQNIIVYNNKLLRLNKIKTQWKKNY